MSYVGVTDHLGVALAVLFLLILLLWFLEAL